MNLSDRHKKICIQVVNVFETGTAEGDYGALVIYADGPNKMRQLTYGRSQTTEYGNLEALVEMYVQSQGIYSSGLRPYLPAIGVVPLTEYGVFKQLLRDAGRKDPIMRRVQDEFFDKTYFMPAINWLDENGFTFPLSALVVYDSQIHSGGILTFLRKRFQEYPPAQGGEEKTWIRQYVDVRRDWLATHTNTALNKTVYRMDCLLTEIARNNWDLSMLPINANGTDING